MYNFHRRDRRGGEEAGEQDGRERRARQHFEPAVGGDGRIRSGQQSDSVGGNELAPAFGLSPNKTR